MNEFILLIEEWETDIRFLEMDLRYLALQVSAPHALAERQRVQRELQRARQAQVLLYDLAQVHTGALSLVA
jgi:hypothetical protein